MIQEILTFIIVFSAAAYTLVQFWFVFFPKKNSQSMCAGGCSACSLKASSTKLLDLK